MNAEFMTMIILIVWVVAELIIVAILTKQLANMIDKYIELKRKYYD